MKIIDSHCHLDLCEDASIALASSQEHHLHGANTIGTKWSERAIQKKLVESFRGSDIQVWGSLGIHPNNVESESLPSLQEMLRELESDGIIGIGETGLDYFRSSESTKEIQFSYFRRHIEASRETGMPVIIHCRQAGKDVLSILDDETRKGKFPFLIHCFAEDIAFAKRIEILGGYISFSGLLTFPKCEAIQEVAKSFPVDRILVETDSPFLAPVPKRGKPNIPGWTYFVAEYLAKLRHCSVEDIASQTTENFYRLFTRAISI
ncbi:TatD family deoxyribonuclease [Acetobacteraceae bacterium]|nr:TatD family deoxyribonuclease [Acetobacteraceae bacterium]